MKNKILSICTLPIIFGSSCVVASCSNSNKFTNFIIKSLPNKLSYISEDNFDLDGFKIVGVQQNGKEVDITNNVTTYPQNGALLDKRHGTVLIYFDDKIISSFNISIQENELEKMANDYSEQYQKSFWENVSIAKNRMYLPEYCNDFYCSSQAEAVALYGYGPGYAAWNKALHDGKGSTELLDNDDETTRGFYSPKCNFERKIRNKDYRYLDSALKLSTTGTLPAPVYHGFESDETELLEFLNTSTGLDIKTASYDELNQKISGLVGKKFVDYGYLATTFKKGHALGWAKSASEYKNSPFFEFEVDSDVYSAYISYSRRSFFDNIFLSELVEYQLLFNRQTNITISNVTLNKSTKAGEPNIIYIKARISKQNI